ncbi:hypothetical protein [Streptomyces sp. rh34]|uniref:hypothetical protein n=1 Tax=Streptomyces sp. rh34 TaxID=2034272 RepID=UPI00117E002F|nr:hypothetical protein [Streptomyces sp. rh34]
MPRLHLWRIPTGPLTALPLHAAGRDGTGRDGTRPRPLVVALPETPHAVDLPGAARALHVTARARRTRYPATPTLWAAYLHAGA